MRASWKRKKERLELQKKVHRRICVSDITFLATLSPFSVFLLLSSFNPFPLSQLTYLRIYIYIYIYIAMAGILCDDIMNKWYYTLFLQATLFFYSASVLLRFFMNWSSNVALVLLNTYNLHYAFYILYLVYLCPSLGLGPFMLYICDLFFIFKLIFIVINNLIKTDAFVFCMFFRISPTIFEW